MRPDQPDSHPRVDVPAPRRSTEGYAFSNSVRNRARGPLVLVFTEAAPSDGAAAETTTIVERDDLCGWAAAVAAVLVTATELLRQLEAALMAVADWLSQVDALCEGFMASGQEG